MLLRAPTQVYDDMTAKTCTTSLGRGKNVPNMSGIKMSSCEISAKMNERREQNIPSSSGLVVNNCNVTSDNVIVVPQASARLPETLRQNVIPPPEPALQLNEHLSGMDLHSAISMANLMR